jgi:hypothetical protein
MKVGIFKRWWTVNDARTRLNCLFVFGDNDVMLGKGGQAIIRDEPNAIGIPTKKYPNNNSDSFYTDDEYKKNIFKINNAINKIKIKLATRKYEILVFPSDGLGTGLAQLNINAPKTYKYLLLAVDQLKKDIKLIT